VSAKAWPIGIGVGLGAVAIANAIMISIALSHPSAPAAEDHWAESLAWDRELELRERSAALGWSVASLTRVDDRRLAVELIDAEGRPLAGLEGSVTLERSDSAAHDRSFALREAGEGRYLGLDELPSAGLYRLTFDLRASSGERFVTRQRVDLGALPQASQLPSNDGGEP
jgi:nitrogen fixation protein FixH